MPWQLGGRPSRPTTRTCASIAPVSAGARCCSPLLCERECSIDAARAHAGCAQTCMASR